jgi:8-oxo-dGTP pyrophosphatase MutT (NUDIX family)
MLREFSAGGVVVRQLRGHWHLAVIEPRGKGPGEPGGGKKGVLALPKGLVDPGERPEQTALREVEEETGVTAELVHKLGDVKYVYTRSFADGQRVFKVVSFYLLRYRAGKIGDIAPEMQHEVSKALWLPLDEAMVRLTYKGERQMASKAQEYVQSHPELRPADTPEP